MLQYFPLFFVFNIYVSLFIYICNVEFTIPYNIHFVFEQQTHLRTIFGFPIGLRSQIKNNNRAEWYKQMYNNMHRNQGRKDATDLALFIFSMFICLIEFGVAIFSS